MADFLYIIAPALITIIGNIIFYLAIKVRLENILELQKIAYSGIFAQKIEIYKNLLSKLYSIKKQIGSYQYFGTDDNARLIMEEINSFIQYYLINQPFISLTMLNELNAMRTEFQDTFDKFYIFHKVGTSKDSDGEERKQLLDEYFCAGNKFKTNEPFKTLENTIIAEMRKDLKTDS